ncbi:MAG: hypothetical protein ABSE73_31375, partial [Planctomycetota bacterium]
MQLAGQAVWVIFAALAGSVAARAAEGLGPAPGTGGMGASPTSALPVQDLSSDLLISGTKKVDY